MKRIFLALLGVILTVSIAQAQVLTIGEKVIPFRTVGATGVYPNNNLGASGVVLNTFADSSYTSRGGAAWGTTVNSQTDTTVWFSTADLPDFCLGTVTRSSSGAVSDSFYVFKMDFTPDPSNVANGLTAAADSIYMTLQASNDGGQNITSATENIVVSPTSSNGFTRTFLSQVLNINKPSGVNVANFLNFKQIRFIISSDINGRYVLSLKYPKLLR